MSMSAPLSFVYPPPPSLILTAMSVASFVLITLIGVSEVMGKHLQYSKFWNAKPIKEGTHIKISGRAGFLVLYAPAFLGAAASFAVPGAVVGQRSLLVASALALHFFKRVFEVLFIHQFSGQMGFDSAILISFSYFSSTVSMIYAQYFAREIPEPAVDLKHAGIVLFLVGICGNFYHHYLLSKLRGKDDKSYKIPRGGLFSLVICPHYLFEILGYLGITFMSQTVYAFSFTTATIIYLVGRSYATRQWYLSKFENFPANVKALVPYIF